MRGLGVKYYLKQNFQSGSPIPYILTSLVSSFLLLFLLKVINLETYFSVVSKLVLPSGFSAWIYQPWALITHPLVYTDLFSILFDCLWLYWIGRLFLNLLSSNNFLFVFLTGLIVGALSFIFLSSFGFLGQPASISTVKFGIAALLTSLIMLAPTLEISLLLLGRIQLRYIAYVYFAIELLLTIRKGDYAISIAYITAIMFGFLYMRSLKAGKDWSEVFKKKKRKLKVVYGHNIMRDDSIVSLPDQEKVDEVLDKISASGYDSLSSKEKEILFKASKRK